MISSSLPYSFFSHLHSQTVSRCQWLLHFSLCHLLEISLIELTCGFGGDVMPMALLGPNPPHICCSSSTSFCGWCSFLHKWRDEMDPISLVSGKIQGATSEQFLIFCYIANTRECVYVCERYQVTFLFPLFLSQ